MSLWRRRTAVLAGCALLALFLTHAGQVTWLSPARAQSTALFIPSDSLVYQAQLSGLDVQDVTTGLRVTATSNETVALVKTQTQVLSGAIVQVSVPAFAYQATLVEAATGVYRTSTQLDVAVQAAADGRQLATADAGQWTVVPQSGAFTLGSVSLSQPRLPPLKISDGLVSKVSMLSGQLSALPPVTGFIANAGISAQSAPSSYQLPVSLAMQAQLLDAGGKPMANRKLAVTAAPNGLAAQTFTVQTDASGSFSYNVTYPATITVAGGSLVNLTGPFRLSGVTADQVTAFWWGGGDSGPPDSSANQTAANLGSPTDPNATGGSDPVNVVTGNMFDNEVDLSYPSVGMPVVFQRIYNNQDTGIGPFGRGWTDSYNLSMAQTQHDNKATMTETTTTGARINWSAIDQNGNFAPPPGAHGTLFVDNNTHTYLKADKHGVRTHYLGDHGGVVDWIKDPNGNQMSFAYDGNNQLVKVTDTAGRALMLSHDANGRVTTLTDALGNAIGYAYDDSGNLASVTYPGGARVTYAYDGAGDLVMLTDPNGNVRSFQYDSQNRAVSFSYARGMERTDFRYDPAHNRTLLTDAAGFQTVYGYQYIGSTAVVTKMVDPMGGVRSYTWDADVNRTSVTDELNRTTRMAYDRQGNLTASTDASGAVTHAQYDAAFNQLTSVSDPLGHTTRYGYDSAGAVTSVTDPLGNTTALARDSRGEVIQSTDPSGNVTSYAYDGSGNLVHEVDPAGGSRSAAYDVLGHLTAVTDALGRTSHLSYSSRYQPVALSAPDASTMRLAYDPAGNVTSITDQLGRTTTLTYDQAGHLTTQVDALHRATTLGYNSRGLLGSFTDAGGNTTTMTYTPVQDVAKAIRPDGSFELLGHDPAHNLTALTDPAGHTTRYGYDALNRLATVTDALGGVTKYAYDAAGDTTSATDANGHAVTYTYDVDGQPSGQTDALGRTTRAAHDKQGRIQSVTDALNQTTTFIRDALGRPTQVHYADGQSVSWTYDAEGNATQMVDGTGTTKYAFDSLDRLLSATLPDGTLIKYAFDAAGERTSLTTPVGTTAYGYDGAGELTQVKDPLGGVTTLGRDALGRATSETFPNGTALTRAYDALGRLTRETFSGARGPQTDIQYGYDVLGNRATRTQNGRQTSVAFDALNRITQVGYPSGAQVRYGYDAVGNRLSQAVSGLPAAGASAPPEEPANGTTNYSYDAADELVSAGSQQLAYDADGELTNATSGGRTTSYTWDARHLLSSVTTPEHQVQYSYDGFGRLATRQEKAGPTLQNVYDGTQLLLQRRASAGGDPARAPWIDFVSGSGQPLSALRTNATGKVVDQQFFQADLQGSLVGVTDQQGQLVDSFAYSAWGTPLGQVTSGQGSGNSQGISDESGYRNFAYVGQPFDPLSGLGQFGARWYQPQSGRFASQDPFPADPALPATGNRYAYALDNPSTLRDPLGLSALTPMPQPGPAPTPVAPAPPCPAGETCIQPCPSYGCSPPEPPWAGILGGIGWVLNGAQSAGDAAKTGASAAGSELQAGGAAASRAGSLLPKLAAISEDLSWLRFAFKGVPVLMVVGAVFEFASLLVEGHSWQRALVVSLMSLLLGVFFALLFAAIGEAIGGPIGALIGAFIGSLIGSFLGDMLGNAIADSEGWP